MSEIRSNAVVLLSGGLDSTTCAAWAVAQGFCVHGLTIDYGQRHHIEIELAAIQAKRLGLVSHQVHALPLQKFGGSALTDFSLSIPIRKPSPDQVPLTYVPARNLNFLALAAAYAEVIGAYDLVIGANAVDYSGYPDCRRPFFDALETTLMLGTKAGSQGQRWQIHTPLIDLTKAQIITLGLKLGVDYTQTSSCYQPDSKGQACGQCEACQLRAKGFAELAIKDPAIAA